MFTNSNVFFKTIDFATKATERYVNVEVQYERCWIFKWMFWLDFIAWPRLKVLYVGFPWFFSTRKPSGMWWYDSSINNIRSKTSILAVRKPNNPKPRRPRVFCLVESSLSHAGFYGFKTVEIEVFDLILLIFTSYHHILLGVLVEKNLEIRHKAPLVWATQ